VVFQVQVNLYLFPRDPADEPVHVSARVTGLHRVEDLVGRLAGLHPDGGGLQGLPLRGELVDRRPDSA